MSRSARQFPPFSFIPWHLLSAMFALALLLSWEVRFAVPLGPAIPSGLGIAALAAIAIIGRRWNRQRLVAASTAFLQLTLFTMLAVVLSYMLAARGGVLWDSRLEA